MRFLGWYNVAYGWDFDNVILLELPDYGTIDQLEARRALTGHRPPRRRVDVRTPSRDVPPRADGTRPRIPPAETVRRPDHDRRRSGALLGEIAMEAGIERASFLNDAADQLHRFLKANRDRIRGPGRHGAHRRGPGLPVDRAGPDLPLAHAATRTRTTGEWSSETEVIESAAELVELYNPADIYAAFAEAARERGRPAGRADRRRGPAGGRRHLARGGRGRRHRRQRPVHRGRRRLGREPGRRGRARRPDRGRTPAVRPGAHLPGAQPAVRGAPHRAVRDRVAAPLAGRARRPAASSTTTTSGCGSRASGAFEAEVLPERDEEDEDAKASGSASRAPRRWSSSTTRPTCSATSRRRSPSSSRRSRPDEVEDEDDEAADGDTPA